MIGVAGTTLPILVIAAVGALTSGLRFCYLRTEAMGEPSFWHHRGLQSSFFAQITDL